MATAIFHEKDSSDELWKECAKWLTRWSMLRADHRANWPEACIADLANILRDGVLLCKLLNKIDPGCIDMKDVNLKPTMAQFLSLHNIKLFLRTCVISFGVKEHHLFDPLVLFELTNFHRVLCTLSELSLSPKAQQGGIKGFNAHKVKSKEEEDQSLKTVEIQSNASEMNDPTYDTAEEIHQDVCDLGMPIKLQQPLEKDKRDFVITELLDTEKNYVDVLAKLMKNFMKPLSAQMSMQDLETVFYKIDKLYDVHSTFYQELEKSRDPSSKLSSTFMRWLEKFLVYGDYCANLTRATNLLQKLCDTDEIFNSAVLACEDEDNNGRFKLRDLLSVPMQRIVKYHLLLEKLIDNTDLKHEEYAALIRAREAMLDVLNFVNEAVGDSEDLAVINNLQENIVEWDRAPHHDLTSFGRLIKYDEMKIKAHGDKKRRNRFVYVFDKCILICKQLKGQQFAFRDIIHLSEYHVKNIHNRAVLKNMHICLIFRLVKNDMVYKVYVKTAELKQQMMDAINSALDNIHPQSMKRTSHSFELQTFEQPVSCFHCSKYLKGLIHQGYKCSVCGIGVHKHCIEDSGRCGSHNHHHSTSSMKSIMNGKRGSRGL